MNNCRLETEKLPGFNDADIWKRRPTIKRLQHQKKSIFKPAKKQIKSKAGIYQRPQRTLAKTHPPEHLESFLQHEIALIDEPPIIQSLEQAMVVEIITVQDDPKPNNYCDVCTKGFRSYATLSAHKKSEIHLAKKLVKLV